MGVQPRGGWDGKGGEAGQGLHRAPPAAPSPGTLHPIPLTRAPAAGLAVRQEPLLQAAEQVRHLGPLASPTAPLTRPGAPTTSNACCSRRAGAGTALHRVGGSGWVLAAARRGQGCAHKRGDEEIGPPGGAQRRARLPAWRERWRQRGRREQAHADGRLDLQCRTGLAPDLGAWIHGHRPLHLGVQGDG